MSIQDNGANEMHRPEQAWSYKLYLSDRESEREREREREREI